MTLGHNGLMRKLGLLSTVSAVSVSMAFFNPAFGQSPEAGSADDDRMMDQVIITSTRRSASIQSVAASVTSLDREKLRALDAVILIDAAGAVPGAEIFDDRGAGQPTWVIRGVGLTDFNVNNTPTAAIYYDDSYMVSNVLGGIGLYDLERVEVLKDPQGGL